MELSDIITLVAALSLTASGLFLMLPKRRSAGVKKTGTPDISAVISVRDASLKREDPARERAESIAPVSEQELEWERNHSGEDDQWSDRSPAIREIPEEEPGHQDSVVSPEEEGASVVGKKADETPEAVVGDPQDEPLGMFDDL